MGEVVRSRQGRPALTENAVVDLVEAAAIRAAVDLGVLNAGRRTLGIKEPIFEVTLVQYVFQYLLMYPGLDRFQLGWEVPIGSKHIDIVMTTDKKAILIECKDFSPRAVNNDARKLRSLQASFDNPASYVLGFWRTKVSAELGDQIERHYRNKRGLDSMLTRLVAHKRFNVYVPLAPNAPFGVALFKVL